jgi:hypothetical protein
MKKLIPYWAVTGVSALFLTFSSFMDLSHNPAVTEGMATLGYPAYLATILGVWKVLAVVALLAPGFPLLKEWAYAGVFFDLTGAAASHAFAGDPVAKVITPLVILGIVAASWWLRPASRRLHAAAAASTSPNEHDLSPRVAAI